MEFSLDVQRLTVKPAIKGIMICKVLEVMRKSRKVLAIMRSRFEACGSECPDIPPCAAKLYGQAKVIRDNLAAVLELAKDVVILAPFRKKIRESLEEWDEFATDCATVSDPEIRELLVKIANVI